jgi:hypothetical protein
LRLAQTRVGQYAPYLNPWRVSGGGRGNRFWENEREREV